MAYTDIEAVKRILGRKLPSGYPVDDIQANIDRAEAHVNASLYGAFEVPFSPVPNLIKSITTDLAVFYQAETLFSSNLPNLDEYQKTRYDRAVTMLHDLVTGSLVLIVGDEIVRPIQDGAGGFKSTSTQQIFNYEDPEW